MNLIFTMTTALLAFGLASAAAAQGSAQPTPDNPHPYTKPPSSKERFSEQEKALQAESRNGPADSPKVDKSVTAADPVPKATTKQDKKARFNELEGSYQQNSRSSASGSPKVEKSARVNPPPKPKTKAEKKAQFTEQEKGLQQQSTP